MMAEVNRVKKPILFSRLILQCPSPSKRHAARAP
jgi:hypothetical protein